MARKKKPSHKAASKKHSRKPSTRRPKRAAKKSSKKTLRKKAGRPAASKRRASAKKGRAKGRAKGTAAPGGRSKVPLVLGGIAVLAIPIALIAGRSSAQAATMPSTQLQSGSGSLGSSSSFGSSSSSSSSGSSGSSSSAGGIGSRNVSRASSGSSSTPSSTTVTFQIGSRSQNAPNGATLISRLRGSAQARKIFYVQLTMFSLSQTQALPDGIQGPVTAGMVSAINRAASAPAGTSTNVSNTTVRELPAAISVWGASLVGMAHGIPQDLINQINSEMRAAAPGVSNLPQLQASPS